MNHNEIVPFTGEAEIDLDMFHPVFIRDGKESQRITRRIEVTQKLLEDRGIEFSEIWSQGQSLITRLFSSIHIGDWVSFYLALLQGVDPTPVRFIDLLKNELKTFKA